MTRSPAMAMRLLVFAAWLAVVVALSADHVIWRDEMRALSFAIQGDGIVAMIRHLHGEGHPAIWYLLLRGAYALVGDTVVLKLVAIAVAAAAAALLVLRSPFSPWLVALLLAGKFMLFEFAVMARNYGISMLLMFVIAVAYPRCRERGFVLGTLLFLLANTNAGATLLVAAFLLFWFLETLFAEGLRWTPRWRVFAGNAALAVLGVAVCAAQVYPPVNDAAAVRLEAVTPLRLAVAVVRPAAVFARSFIDGPWTDFGGVVADMPYRDALKWLVSLLMFGSAFGLVRRPAALVAVLFALLANALFFTLVYPGQYRHQALWLVFLTTMYWIAAQTSGGARRPLVDRTAKAGFAMFVALLALQLPGSVRAVVDLIAGDQPFSRSRDLALLIAADPRLHDAVVIADPDYFVESLPYYVDNPTYLIRQRKFGRYAAFTVNARLELSLADILDAARTTSIRAGRPVVILLEHRLDRQAPAARIPEGYNWVLTTTPAQVRSFQAMTILLARFGPAVSGETFDVYLFPLPVRHGT